MRRGVRGDCQNVHPEVSRHVCWYHLTHQLPLTRGRGAFSQILWKKKDGNIKHLWSSLNTRLEPLSGDLPQRHRTESSYETNRMSIEEKKLSFIWKVVKSDITSSERIKFFHYPSRLLWAGRPHVTRHCGKLGGSGVLIRIKYVRMIQKQNLRFETNLILTFPKKEQHTTESVLGAIWPPDFLTVQQRVGGQTQSELRCDADHSSLSSLSVGQFDISVFWKDYLWRQH